MTYLIFGAVTIAVSFLAVAVLRPVLIKLGVVDVPSERSSHTSIAIRGLGLGIFVAFVVGWALAFGVDHRTRVTIVITVVSASVAAALLGLAEDLRGLSVPVRSTIQLVIAVAAAWTLTAEAGAPWWLAIYAVFFLSSYINVANFMDGLNGISGFHGVVAGATFALCGTFSNIPWLIVTGIILAAAFTASCLRTSPVKDSWGTSAAICSAVRPR